MCGKIKWSRRAITPEVLDKKYLFNSIPVVFSRFHAYPFSSRRSASHVTTYPLPLQALGPDGAQNLGPDIIGSLPSGNQKKALFKLFSTG